MAIQSAPYYWIVCDTTGCDAKEPDHEVSAWAEEDTALISAAESDWLVAGSKHYCPDHAWQHCRDCGKTLSEDELGTGGSCFQCLPVEAD